MEPEESLESLSYDTTDVRNRRGAKVGNPKKRLNKKEQRERGDKIEKRAGQRSEFQSRKEEEEAAQRLAELNAELTAGALRKAEEEAKRQAIAARREENRKLYEEVMIKDAIGEAPSSQDTRKHEEYEQRKKTVLQPTTGAGRGKKKPGPSVNRAALLKTMAAQLTSS